MKRICLAVALGLALAPAAAGATEIVLAQAEKPTGTGTINSIDPSGKKLNMTHGPVAALKWPGMTMDFNVASGVDLSALKAGQKVVFTLSRGAAGYMIDSIRPE